MPSVVNINDILDGHVALDVACIDRLYLNAYVPNLRVGGQVEQFCRHLGQPIGSPAVLEKIGNRFRREVDVFAKAHGVPVLHLKKPDRSRWDDRKLDHVRPYLDRAEAAGRYGVVAEGGDIKVLQRMLGHASAALTLDRYGHCSPGKHRAWRNGSTRRPASRPLWIRPRDSRGIGGRVARAADLDTPSDQHVCGGRDRRRSGDLALFRRAPGRFR